MEFATKCLLLALPLIHGGNAFAQDAANRVNTLPFGRLLPAPSDSEVKRGANAIKIPKNVEVPAEWIPLLNRAYEEYWMEGNHRPDAGFVLFARNPSKETAKLWLLRMESKAKNLEEMFAHVKEAQRELVTSGLMVDRYHMVHQHKSSPNSISPSAPSPESFLKSKTVFSDLHFYFLYSPNCPHCAHLAKNLVGFPNVRPLQVTGGDLVNWPDLPKSDHATSETIEDYVKDGDQPGGVPVLAIYQPKTNRVLKLRGARSVQEILAAAALVHGTPDRPPDQRDNNSSVHQSKMGEPSEKTKSMPDFPKM